MADDTVQNGTDTIATDHVTSLNGTAVTQSPTSPKVQRVKVAFGDDGTSRDASDGFPLPTRARPWGAGTGAVTTPALATTSFTVLAANTNRLGVFITNDTSAWVHVALSGTTSTTAFTVKLAPESYWELPVGAVVYTGIITGIASATGGNLKVTELT